MATVTGLTAARMLEIEADLNAAVSGHITDTVDAHNASAISFAPAGTIAAADVQAAIEEVSTETAAHTHSAAKGFVNHGSDANVVRPTGYASVEWIGSVEPINAIDGDTWRNTT